MRILIIAAHPDDEVLGCGGIISRASQEGHDIYIAILGEGITSRYKQRHGADTGLVESLREKARKVAEFLGARDAYSNDLPDNRFDTVPLLEITKIVENLIGRIKPRVIYTHHAGDLNIDHVIPKSKGGKEVWGNLVCACIECNIKKGNKLPVEAGMKLIRKPSRPNLNPLIIIHLSKKKYASWKTFLNEAYWNVELQEY